MRAFNDETVDKARDKARDKEKNTGKSRKGTVFCSGDNHYRDGMSGDRHEVKTERRTIVVAEGSARVDGTRRKGYMNNGSVGIPFCVAALLLALPVCAGTRSENVALGKHVTSEAAGSSEYRRSADRLTDGNLETDAYPGAFSLDYTVSLLAHAGKDAAVDAASYDVQTVVIHWGKFGRHFPGAKQADGSWVPAAYEADYVNGYRVEYLTRRSEEWTLLHECKGRPTDEKAEGVLVRRDPASATSSEGNVTTTLDDLPLRDVIAIRIRATGAHWIGVYELEALGFASSPASSGTTSPDGNRAAETVSGQKRE